MAFLLDLPPVPSAEKFYGPRTTRPAKTSAMPPPPPPAAAPASTSAGPEQQAEAKAVKTLTKNQHMNVLREHASIARALSRALRAPVAKMSSADYCMAQRISNVSTRTARYGKKGEL